MDAHLSGEGEIECVRACLWGTLTLSAIDFCKVPQKLISESHLCQSISPINYYVVSAVPVPAKGGLQKQISIYSHGMNSLSRKAVENQKSHVCHGLFPMQHTYNNIYIKKQQR